MIGTPKSDDFILILDDAFLYEDVKEKYDLWFRNNNFMFQSLVDYMNSSITSVSFYGRNGKYLTQTRGGNSKESNYKSGHGSEKAIVKEFKVTFKMMTGYINYFIMQDMFDIYANNLGKTNDEIVGDDAFLHPITQFILDDDQTIIFQRTYSKIVMTGITDLNLNKQNNSVRALEFTCTFRYTDVDDKFNGSDNINITDDQYIY